MRSGLGRGSVRGWVALLAAALAVGTVWRVTAEEPAPVKLQAEAASIPFTIGEETTRLDGPLTESGLIDYLQAFNEQGMQGLAPEDNAVVLYLKVLGPRDLPYEYRDQFFQELGIDPLPNDGDYLQHLGDYIQEVSEDNDFKQEEINQQYYRAMAGPWRSDDCPDLARWMKVNDKFFEMVAKGSECPTFFMPQVRIRPEEENVLVPGGRELQASLDDLTYYFQIRGLQKAGEGDLLGAFEQFMVIRRIGRQLGRTRWATSQSSVTAYEMRATQAEELLLTHPDFSAKFARLFMTRLQELEDIRPLSETYDHGERYAVLDQVQHLSVGNLEFLRQYGWSRFSGQRVNVAIQLATEQEIDWDEVLRVVNDWYDRLVAACEQEEWTDRRDTLQAFHVELNEFIESHSPEPIADLDPADYSNVIAAQLLALLMQNSSTSYEEEISIEARVNLRITSLALAAYKVDHDSYPRDLSELCPDYLTEIPLDPYSGEPVLYQRRGRDYLIYSVGPNTFDDNGDYNYRDRDDVTLRRW